jgi:hypothetical protein
LEMKITQSFKASSLLNNKLANLLLIMILNCLALRMDM